jgi:hypothetical protein
MPALLFVFMVRAIEALCKQMRKARAPKPRPLCTERVHAHVQYAVDGRCAISCTFAGTVRPVAIEVQYCTDCHDRNAEPVVVRMGFVHEIGTAESVADMSESTASEGPLTRRDCLAGLRSFRAPPVHSSGMGRPRWERNNQFRRWCRRRLLRTPKCLRTSWTSEAGQTATAVTAHSPVMF